MSIVSLEMAKQHLRYDDDESDQIIQAYLDAAESVVLEYITDTFDG